MSKALEIFTTSLFFTLMGVLAFMSPSLVHADADEGFSTPGRLQTSTSFAQPWVVANAMADQCKKMAAGRGQYGDVFFEYCLAQAPGSPTAGKASGCYAKHPMDLEKFKACVADAKVSPSLPKSSPPSSAPFPSPPPMPSADEIAAQAAADEDKQRALKDKMWEEGFKAAGKENPFKYSVMSPEAAKGVFDKTMLALQAKGSANLPVEKVRAGEVLERYSILKRIDPDGAKDMLDVAAKTVVKSEWKNAGGTGEIGAQDSFKLAQLAKQNPDAVLVEHYKDHNLPLYDKRVKDLKISQEERELFRKWREYGTVRFALTRGRDWGSFGTTAKLLGLPTEELIRMAEKEQAKLDKLWREGQIDGDHYASLGSNIEKLFTDIYLGNKHDNDARMFASSRVDFPNARLEEEFLRFMTDKYMAEKSGEQGNCDWVRGDYHVPNGTPLCHNK